jgi:hypothetical protein
MGLLKSTMLPLQQVLEGGLAIIFVWVSIQK